MHKMEDDKILFTVLNMITEIPILTCQSDIEIFEWIDRLNDANLTDLFVRKLGLQFANLRFG